MISTGLYKTAPITPEMLDKYFPIVPASELRLSDKFLTYKPYTPAGINLKQTLQILIEDHKANDFRAQSMDPSINHATGKIYYCEGERPAIGLSAIEWKKAFADFLPEYGSKLGTCDQRCLFLGHLINTLVIKKGYSVEKAWKAVCIKSSDMGNFWDSHQARHGLEPTGRRQIDVWYDLGNTCKLTVLHEDSFIFYYIGGFYAGSGSGFPIAEMDMVVSPHKHCLFSVGWGTLPAKVNFDTPLTHILNNK